MNEWTEWMMLNLQSYPTTVLKERMWHFYGWGEVKAYADSYIFSGGQDPQTPMIYVPDCNADNRSQRAYNIDEHCS